MLQMVYPAINCRAIFRIEGHFVFRSCRSFCFAGISPTAVPWATIGRCSAAQVWRPWRLRVDFSVIPTRRSS
jgi:hypothetical protein